MNSTLESFDLQTSWPTTAALPDLTKRKRFALLASLPFMLALALGGALVAKSFLFQFFYIPSASMEPTLIGNDTNGDRVLVNKLVYKLRDPRRGEVIVFVAQPDEEVKSLAGKIIAFFTEGLGVTKPNETDFIKRIIALPGETIEVTATDVFVTPIGKPRQRLVEPYIKLEGQNISLLSPTVVPQDHVFVMGDNRNNSSDSRSSLGPVPIERIIGKAFVKVWPPTRMGQIATPTYERRARGAQQRAAAPTDIPLLIPGLLALVGSDRRFGMIAA